MKKLTLITLFASCTSTTSVLSPEEARVEVARAFCERIVECSPTSFFESYPSGIDECASQSSPWLDAPDMDPSSCVESLARTTCDDRNVFDHGCRDWYNSAAHGGPQ